MLGRVFFFWLVSAGWYSEAVAAMQHVMVLGASGFIGRWCVDKLLESGSDFRVHGVSRHAPRWAKQYAERLTWHQVDLLDGASTKAAITKVAPTTLLHLGWFSGHGQIWTTAANLDWAAAALHIAKSFEAAGGDRLVIAGTCAEYNGSGIFKEDDAGFPETLYGMAKLSTRLLVEAFCSTNKVRLAWPRLFHMYGPNEDGRRLVASAIQAMLRGAQFDCSDCEQVRDFLHVADVGDALVTLTNSSVTGVINVGSGDPKSLRQILEAAGRAAGRPELLRFGVRPRALKDPDMMVPDVTRQSDALGWRPAYNLATGMADTVEWWRSQQQPSIQLHRLP